MPKADEFERCFSVVGVPYGIEKSGDSNFSGVGILLFSIRNKLLNVFTAYAISAGCLI